MLKADNNRENWCREGTREARKVGDIFSFSLGALIAD
jgi:hypothetical protein